MEIFQFLILFSLLFTIDSQSVVIKGREITSQCEKNLYKIIINIETINPLTDYVNFYLDVSFTQNLLFKCIIDPIKKQIICIANLQQQKATLKNGDRIILPYPFPEVKGIIWDYRSFLFRIFRKTIVITEECGESVLKSNITKLHSSKWDLITKINKIYDGKCLLSSTTDNYFSFNMNFEIIGGNLKSLLEKSNKDNTKAEIHLMQNITMPFVVGVLQTLIKVNFMYQSHEYYKLAFCHPLEDITSVNYLKEGGIDFHCDIPISDNYIFNGPMKVKTFSDNVYAKVTSATDEDKIDFISIYFSTEKNPVLNQNDEIIENGDDDDSEDDLININNQTQSSPQNLRSLQLDINVNPQKKKEVLLLDNRASSFICPDKPVFEITNLQNGIIFEPFPDRDDKYNIILTGYLKNGYKITNKKLTKLEYTPDEIKFNLSVTNNLIEETTEKKSNVTCYVSSGTMFLEKETSQIKCLGEKYQKQQMENTDITVNWASKENKYLNNIVIHWPKDLTVHSKKLYSYDIHALSIKKTDFDCYDNKYYFYVNILDLKSEPQISFDINMREPLYIKSNCKLYSSTLLKCFIDLNLKKIKKGTRIRLPFPGNYNISTLEGNYINFTVMNLTDGNSTDFADEGIIADETCGNNVVVGAIQNIGYNYASTIALIISFFVIFFGVLFLIMYCIVYEITHRNKKEGYFAHTEERKDPTNISTSISPVMAPNA